ncbi:hypothetical protein [Caldinitratiruptor microaerophilus]|uniref:Uncharacterized protein n=1 Tax=Caldinitratiruptor microaerophilus TaxID=671077 RepID=A0AA35CLQ4_9FIRM|nr:hypothetical protein [Caldinitratiruptor microaerophilus]BDG59847.1 hypothetical protein caldi_09370 [Caldinitratiruptor microaerophilus]
MSEAAAATARINLRDGTFEFHGPTDFVAQQLERYHDLIEMVLTKKGTFDRFNEVPAAEESTVAPTAATPAKTETEEALERHFGVSREQLERVVHFDSDGAIKILAGVKGSKAEQQRKLCLLYLLTKDFLTSDQPASAEELRELCKEHACYDQNNFASNLKGTKFFVVTGKGASASYRLTAPGREEARRVLAALVGVPS